MLMWQKYADVAEASALMADVGRCFRGCMQRTTYHVSSTQVLQMEKEQTLLMLYAIEW